MQNQQQIEAHLAAGKAVFVCERAIDCTTLTVRGCVATVANGEFPDIFKGRRVVLVSGVGSVKFAESTKASLEAAGAQVVKMTAGYLAGKDKAALAAAVGELFKAKPEKDAMAALIRSLPPEPKKKRNRPLGRKPDNLPVPIVTADPDVTDPETPPQARSYGSLAAQWSKLGLSLNGQGMPHANAWNALKVLEQDSSLLGTVWFDTFLQRLQTDPHAPRDWTDGDDVRLMLYIQGNLAIPKMGVESVRHAVVDIARRFPRNCLADSINAMPKWDGIARCDQFFVDCFGAPNTPYALAAGGNFWKSLVARAQQPGCKVDNMVILEGLQGIQKSTACAVIVGEHFFAEAHENVTSKDFFIGMQGKWLIEINEMDAFSRAEVTKINQVITCRTDRYRPPFGRNAVDHPRQSIFIGTTNRDDYNRDETGARRLWPIRCTEIRVDLIRENRQQLLAEALHCINAGETWWEMPDMDTKAEQRQRLAEDPWLDPVAQFVELLRTVTVANILQDALRIEVGKQNRGDQMRVGGCLRTLGWTKKAEWRGQHLLNVWRPPSTG